MHTQEFKQGEKKNIELDDAHDCVQGMALAWPSENQANTLQKVCVFLCAFFVVRTNLKPQPTYIYIVGFSLRKSKGVLGVLETSVCGVGGTKAVTKRGLSLMPVGALARVNFSPW